VNLSLWKNYFNFISFRRFHLDKNLTNISYLFENKKVLEIGANPVRRRGNWRPPTNVMSWKTSNIDDSIEGVDFIIELPKINVDIGTYDVVLCTEVLEYVTDVELSMTGINNALNQNGLFIWSVPFLHPEHADFISDFRRFTNSYIIKLEADNFKKLR